MAEIITTDVAAERLGVSVQRVRQLVKELGIEPQTLRGAFILSAADLKRLERRNTKRGPSKKTKS